MWIRDARGFSSCNNITKMGIKLKSMIHYNTEITHFTYNIFRLFTNIVMYIVNTDITQYNARALSYRK